MYPPPMAFHPVRWTPAPDPGLSGPYAPNGALTGAELWSTGGHGPEDVLVDPEGRVWCGLEDGRILRFAADGSGREVVAETGGRPLGLEWHPEGWIVVCDARRGLLRLSPGGGGLGGEVEVLVDRVDGDRLRFTNNAAVTREGAVYFTDTSRHFGIEEYKQDLLEHSSTGRLLLWREGHGVETLLDGLSFANGVALSEDESWLLVAETGTYSIERYWLRGPRAGSRETFVDNLPGFPDNLSRWRDTFWLAMPSPRDRLLDRLLPGTLGRHVVARLPDAFKPRPKRHGLVFGFGPDGTLRHNLQDPTGRVAIVTGVRQKADRLYLGSLSEPCVAVVPAP